MATMLKTLTRRQMFNLSFNRLVSSFNVEADHLSVTWDKVVTSPSGSGHSNLPDKYPYIWLRDNCQCPKCYSSSALARKFDTRTLNLDEKPRSVEIISKDGPAGGDEEVAITWSDGHQSQYKESWLKPRCFSRVKQCMIDEDFKVKKLWGKEMQGNVKSYQYRDLLDSEASVLKMLCDLSKYGVVLLANGPNDGKSSALTIGEQIVNTVGVPIKPTNYGEKFYFVENKPNPNNAAYEPERLNLHRDLPFHMYIPGIQILHCITQEDVSDVFNPLADGFYVADVLKQQYPHYYKVLSEVPVIHHDIGTDWVDFHLRTERPILEHDHNGDLFHVNINNVVRSCYTFPSEQKQLRLWYESYQKFYELLYENSISVKPQSGQTMFLDNLRILHGREGTVLGERVLCGWYYDWDFVNSKIRVTQKKLVQNTCSI